MDFFHSLFLLSAFSYYNSYNLNIAFLLKQFNSFDKYIIIVVVYSFFIVNSRFNIEFT